MTDLSFDACLRTSFEVAIERVTAALKEQGFGVLTRIDVHKAFEEKLGEGFRPYAILGACNPELAHAALSEKPEVGLLLPCNVTVEQTDPDQCLVRIINPQEMMKPGGFERDPTLAKVGGKAEESLRKVAESIRR